MNSHKNIFDIPDVLLKQITNKHTYSSPIISDILINEIIPNALVQTKGKLRIACKFLLFSTLSNDQTIPEEKKRHQQQSFFRLEIICSKALRAITDYRRSNKGGKTGEKRAYYYSEIISNKDINIKHKAVAIYAILKLEGGTNLKSSVNTAIASVLENNSSSVDVVASKLMGLIITNESGLFSSANISQLANEFFKFKDTLDISKTLKKLYSCRFLSAMAGVYSEDYQCQKLNESIVKMLNQFEARTKEPRLKT